MKLLTGQLKYLKHNSDIRRQWQTFTVRQRQQLIVVQHWIQIFYPFRIHVTIEYNPLPFIDLAAYVINNFPKWIDLASTRKPQSVNYYYLKMWVKSPSVHSLVLGSSTPYKASLLIALGSMTWATPSTPSNRSKAFKSTRQAVLLPEPLGPTIIKPWFKLLIWYSCNTCHVKHD